MPGRPALRVLVTSRRNASSQAQRVGLVDFVGDVEMERPRKVGTFLVFEPFLPSQNVSKKQQD